MPEFDAPLFNRGMLCCHMSSSVSLCLFFAGFLTGATEVRFELVLLLLKTVAELCAEPPFTVDLAAHHFIMLCAAVATLTWFTAYIFLVVHVQAIHLALSVKYARQIAGHDARSSAVGRALDRSYVLLFVFVLVARITMLTRSCWEALVGGTWILISIMGTLSVGIAALDATWIRELFARRAPPGPGTFLVAALGMITGILTTSTATYARHGWGLSCIVALSSVTVAFAARPSTNYYSRLAGD